MTTFQYDTKGGEKVGGIWQKFHAIFGSDLKVGFETTFPREAVLDLDPLYERNGLIHKAPRGSVTRIYAPATIEGSCRNGEEARILFSPVSREKALFCRLMFARKIGDDKAPRLWMVIGRHGEIATFGFDSWNNDRDQRYQPIAYPGREREDGKFKPVYVKIRNSDEFVYLKLQASDEESAVLFTARRVSEDVAPKNLVSAMPQELVERTPLTATTMARVAV